MLQVCYVYRFVQIGRYVQVATGRGALGCLVQRYAGRMADDTSGVGARVRYWRLRRKLTQQTVADLAGISRSYLAMIESGERALDRRSRIASLARALRITPTDLTGEPVPAGDDALAEATAALPALRLALLGSTLDEPADVEPRPLAALRAEVARVDQLVQASDYAAFSADLPALIVELQVLAARGHNGEWQEAVRLLVLAGQAAFYAVKDLGDTGTGYVAAERVREAGQRAEDPTATALGDFLLAHALLPIGGYARALRACDRAADDLRPRPDDSAALEVYGMLNLTAALTSVSAGRPNDADDRVAEAAEVAVRVGDGTNAYGLSFGAANVAAWRIALAVERGEGGRVAELAREVNPSALPAGRRAAFWTDVGRGLAQTRNRDADALTALRRAEDLAPQQVRSNPMVREVVGSMVRRARRTAGGPELVGLAHRLGVG